MPILYGIKNCDTTKKARRWLTLNGIEYDFHDYKVDGLSPKLLDYLEDQLGWEKLLNRRSTSWRQLSDFDRDNLNREKAKTLMLVRPTLIKRPILDNGCQLMLGFSSESYEKIL